MLHLLPRDGDVSVGMIIGANVIGVGLVRTSVTSIWRKRIVRLRGLCAISVISLLMFAPVSLIRWLNQWLLRLYVGIAGNVLNGAIVSRLSDVRIALNRLLDVIAPGTLTGVRFVPINGADV
jgi:hypothetical protein